MLDLIYYLYVTVLESERSPTLNVRLNECSQCLLLKYNCAHKQPLAQGLIRAHHRHSLRNLSLLELLGLVEHRAFPLLRHLLDLEKHLWQCVRAKHPEHPMPVCSMLLCTRVISEMQKKI